MARMKIDQYFMKIAHTVSERATCDRLHVGCVLVKNKMILATGYNGSASGAKHCDDVGHLIIDGHCVRTVHSEVNAICSAAKHGVSIDGATAYCSHEPCFNCTKTLINAGVRKVYFANHYQQDASKRFTAKMSMTHGRVNAWYDVSDENLLDLVHKCDMLFVHMPLED